MAAAVTLTTPVISVANDVTEQCFIYTGVIVLSGTYAAGGQAVSFISVPGNAGPPISVRVFSKAGYGMFFTPGSTIANGLLYITTASNTELAAGAYPAGLTADTITFEARFFKFA